MLEEDPEFTEEFKRVFNNTDILEADGFTPQLLEDTYVDMKIALLRDKEGPGFAKVKKFLQGADDILIGMQHDNPMMDTRVHAVEYLDGHKA